MKKGEIERENLNGAGIELQMNQLQNQRKHKFEINSGALGIEV